MEVEDHEIVGGAPEEPTDQGLQPQEEFVDELVVPPAPKVPKSTLMAAEFIMKVRDGKGLTQVTTDGILQDTKMVVQNTLVSAGEKFLEKLRALQLPITEDQLSELMSIFSEESLVDPFRDLTSFHKQDKFIQENFNYVVSMFHTNTVTRSRPLGGRSRGEGSGHHFLEHSPYL